MLIVKEVDNLPGELGIYASELIPKRTNITPYAGKIIYAKPMDCKDSNISSHYFTVHSGTNKTIAGLRSAIRGFGVGSLANHVKRTDRNAEVIIGDYGSAFLKSTRDIQPNEQILIYYGTDYWKRTKLNQPKNLKKRSLSTSSTTTTTSSSSSSSSCFRKPLIEIPNLLLVVPPQVPLPNLLLAVPPQVPNRYCSCSD